MQLPPSLIFSLNNVKGFDKKAFEEIHSGNQQVTSIRINPEKQFPIPDASIPQLSIPHLQFQKIPWSTNGYYLTERPSFTLDPLFHAGAYYVQEASSMFLEEVIRQTIDIAQPLQVLDLCAAPGGKSTLIQSILSAQSILVSNEVIKNRVNILTENITKWGAANVVVTNNDPAHFKRLSNYFDVIVVDAPCSGSGLFRKDTNAIAEWSEQNVQLCSQRQQRILADIFSSLKENGILIYSTCSYSAEENEEIADWLMSNYPLSPIKINIDQDWNIVETTSAQHNAYGYRFYPYKLKGEGFFIAAFKKLSAEKISFSSPKNKIEKLSAIELQAVKKYVNDPSLNFIKNNNEIIALPAHVHNSLTVFQSVLYIKKIGITMGTVIKNELIPAHDLALSSIIKLPLPSVEVPKETALQYLRRQNIFLDTDHVGWTLIKYRNLPLGWVKILTNRINNYYPNLWRILKK